MMSRAQSKIRAAFFEVTGTPLNMLEYTVLSNQVPQRFIYAMEKLPLSLEMMHEFMMWMQVNHYIILNMRNKQEPVSEGMTLPDENIKAVEVKSKKTDMKGLLNKKFESLYMSEPIIPEGIEPGHIAMFVGYGGPGKSRLLELAERSATDPVEHVEPNFKLGEMPAFFEHWGKQLESTCPCPECKPVNKKKEDDK